MVDIWLTPATTEEDFEFIRLLRTDARTIQGFIEQGEITREQQLEYMKKYASCYWVAESANDRINLGFIGVIHNDIRYCVVPYFQNKGYGVAMLNLIKARFPYASGKIKKDNHSSIRAFEKAGIPYTLV